jgi:hypothetical protein
MASSKKVQITLELPAEITKLSREEVSRLREIFRTEIANVLSSRVPESLLATIIKNVNSGGGTKSESTSASKKSSSRAGKGGAKKSSKKR